MGREAIAGEFGVLTLGIENVVFAPARNVPTADDFLKVTQINVDNLQSVFVK
ncbi:MAG: hypothetical protein AAGC93_30870 [Cyanobacteria bacterium P01_F01_bin.53]